MLEKMKADGKIVDYSAVRVEQVSEPQGRIITKTFRKKSAGLDFISTNLFYWCAEKKLKLYEEYRFDRERRWRFDWAIPGIPVAVEYEGGIFDRNGSHTSYADIQRDTEKYN